MSVKKKESRRKTLTNKTGGGPPPDITFKPWELDVLSLIPEETITGLAGAVDSDIKANPTESDDEPGCLGSSKTGNIPIIGNPFIIEEVEMPIAEDEHFTGAEERAEEPSVISASRGRRSTFRLYENKKKEAQDPCMTKLILLKKRRVEVEERKASALEKIASALEKRYN